MALLRGPLVLFAIGAAPLSKLAVAREELLAAARVDGPNWEVTTRSGGVVKMRPFTAIGDEQYSTYLTVSQHSRDLVT